MCARQDLVECGSGCHGVFDGAHIFAHALEERFVADMLADFTALPGALWIVRGEQPSAESTGD